jgi:hypothetical protein
MDDIRVYQRALSSAEVAMLGKSNMTGAKMAKTLFADSRLTVSPNPFNPESHILYSLPASGHVHLAVYDLSGRLVKTLVSGEMKAGQHTTRWDATNTYGQKVSCGIYLYHLATQGMVLQFKSVLAK